MSSAKTVRMRVWSFMDIPFKRDSMVIQASARFNRGQLLAYLALLEKQLSPIDFLISSAASIQIAAFNLRLQNSPRRARALRININAGSISSVLFHQFGLSQKP